MAFVTAAGLAYASLATTVISTGVAVYGQMQQAKAAEETAEFNAKIAENEANLKQQRGLENIRRQRAQNRRYLSRQRALISGRGIALEGTALEVLGQSAGKLEVGIQDAFADVQIGVNRSLSEAESQRFQGYQASKASMINAGSSLLSGVGTLGANAFTFKEKGAI
jgi:hypothetical protein